LFNGGQNSRRIANYGTDIKEENFKAVFTSVPQARSAVGDDYHSKAVALTAVGGKLGCSET
jgi:hypothetical protein